MIFFTRSCAHLQDIINMPVGNVTVGQFKDGELLVQVHEDVQGKQVWVCSSTIAPAENILETFFLLDALKRAGASVKLLFVYFGYARQDRVLPGQPVSCEVICHCLQQFRLESIHVVHIHNPGVCAYLSLQNHIPFDFFGRCMTDVDLIVAPDEGATMLAKLVAAHHHKPYIVTRKIRPEKEKVEIREIEGDVKGKNTLIVDDMISTGSTIVKVSELLQKKGAQKIIVAATHGLFSDQAYKAIDASAIDKVFVTNSLAPVSTSSKVHVIDISSFLRAILT